MAGYGAGTLTLTPTGDPAIWTDMDLTMGALGVRGVALGAPADGRMELTVTEDAGGGEASRPPSLCMKFRNSGRWRR